MDLINISEQREATGFSESASTRIQLSLDDRKLLNKYVLLIEEKAFTGELAAEKLDITFSPSDGEFLKYKMYMGCNFKVKTITGRCTPKTEKIKIKTENGDFIYLILNNIKYLLRFPDGAFVRRRKLGDFDYLCRPPFNTSSPKSRKKRRQDSMIEVMSKIDELNLNGGSSDAELRSQNTTDDSVFSSINKVSERQSIETVEPDPYYDEEKVCLSAATTLATIILDSLSPT